MLACRPATIFVGQPAAIRPGQRVSSGSTASQSCSGAARAPGDDGWQGIPRITEVRG